MNEETLVRTDNELVNLTLDNDKEYFSQLVVRYYPKLSRYLYRLLNGNQNDVDECLADTFMKAFMNLATYSSGLSFSSWIYRIAHNQAIDLMRKKMRSATVPLEEFHAPHDPSKHYEEKDYVEHILAFLSIEDRNLLTLFYLEELSLNDISDMLKIKPNTLAVRIKRIRERLKIQFPHK